MDPGEESLPVTRMLESEEAARRLGVKMTTLYAYVSRGVLRSYPAPGGRRSLFALQDVETLARRARGGRRVESRLATVTTAITQLREDGPAYRGRPATALSASASYEEVADLLWAVGASGPDDWCPVALGDRPSLGASDRIRWAVVMAGARDPLRSDDRPEAVTRAARRLIATIVGALDRSIDPGSGAPPGTGPGGGIARRLACCLAAEPDDGLAEAIDASLVLLADHELATSSVAVRVAASTRADLYEAMLSGLGTVAGPLHGGASRLAFGLLEDAARRGPEQALNDTLRWQRMLPGFGHPVYRTGDPRATVLLEHFDRMADPRRRDVVHALVDLAAVHDLPSPNVDLALAALAWAGGMGPDAGRTIFTVARLAGWTAHYLEELGEEPLRFRTRAVYSSGDQATVPTERR